MLLGGAGEAGGCKVGLRPEETWLSIRPLLGLRVAVVRDVVLLILKLRVARVDDLRSPVLILHLGDALRRRVVGKDRPSQLAVAVVRRVVRDSCDILGGLQAILLGRIQRSPGRDHPQAVVQVRVRASRGSRWRQAACKSLGSVLEQCVH